MAQRVKQPLAQEKQPAVLPFTGKSRFASFEAFLPFSKERFRQLVRDGFAPPAERMGVRCTFYDNAELHRFLADPLNYRASDSKKGGAQ